MTTPSYVVRVTVGSGVVTYDGIVDVKLGRDGALRLYRRRRLSRVQDVYHPPGEWSALTVSRTGGAV